MEILVKGIVFVLFIFTLTSFSQQKAGDLRLEPYVFESASKEKVGAELGHVLVPENRKNPNSKLIELAFVRFKTTSANPGAPIVYLAGGPGGSGIAAARGTRFPLFLAMREIGDVIALDQRGTGISQPNMNCTEPISLPLDEAPSREKFNALIRETSRACAERLRKQGIDLAGYNTNESADDIDDLRKALRAEKVILWAISYGTHLALTAIRRHEKNIEKAVLAGVEGLEHTVKLPSNIQKHLEDIDRLIKSDPKLSAAIPSFSGLVKEVFEKVDRQPVTVEVNDPQSKQKIKVILNKFALQLVTAFAFGNGEASFPAGYYAMSKGDFQQAGLRWLSFVRSNQSVGSAMASMMDCYSGISPARRKRVAEEAKTSLLADVMDYPIPDICDAWGNPDLGESFRSPVRAKIPVLFISGTFDVRTPPSNAEEVRRGFPISEHLIIDGAVHSDPLFLSSPKIKDVILEFMRGQKISTNTITLAPIKFIQVGN